MERPVNFETLSEGWTRGKVKARSLGKPKYQAKQALNLLFIHYRCPIFFQPRLGPIELELFQSTNVWLLCVTFIFLGSPGGQRASSIKQITTKGAATQIHQEGERKFIVVFIPGGLRASSPKSTSISPPPLPVHLPLHSSNSTNFCACSAS